MEHVLGVRRGLSLYLMVRASMKASDTSTYVFTRSFLSNARKGKNGAYMLLRFANGDDTCDPVRAALAARLDRKTRRCLERGREGGRRATALISKWGDARAAK